MNAIIELAKVLIPAVLMLYLAYLLVRMYVNKEIEMRKLEIRNRSIDNVLPLRLQAAERITLLLERISPQNLLVRLSSPHMPARDLHQSLLRDIRDEYNHNVAQQVYLSPAVWDLVRNAKEDLIVTINDAAGEMKLDSTALELSKKIFEKYVNKPVDPLAHALTELKTEMQRLF